MNHIMHQLDFSLPAGLRVYAIGDIHGYLSALDNMHEAIDADLKQGEPPKKVMIVYMGDYVDRGPDSSGVLSRLVEYKQRDDGITRVFLTGNHEVGMLEFIRNSHSGGDEAWLGWGGFETLLSYGVPYILKTFYNNEGEEAARRLKACIPAEHMDFLNTLEPCFRIGGFFFAHAGVDPLASLGDQSLHDLTFMREPFLSWDQPLECVVVHGHTITREPVVKPHRIGIDTGLYQGGRLTAAVIEGQHLRFLQVTK